MTAKQKDSFLLYLSQYWKTKNGINSQIIFLLFYYYFIIIFLLLQQ